MRILLLSHSFNSLTQRLHLKFRERGHAVSVELDIHAAPGATLSLAWRRRARARDGRNRRGIY